MEKRGESKVVIEDDTPLYFGCTILISPYYQYIFMIQENEISNVCCQSL
jgi:hypothetical protein